MESGKVDESISGEEEVGDEWRNGVQFSDNNTTQGNKESQNVAIDRLIVLSVAFTKGPQIRIEFILA